MQYADVMAAMEGGEAALLESLTPTAKTVEALTKMSGKLQFLIKLLDIFEGQCWHP